MGLLVASERELAGDRTNPIRDQPPARVALDALPGRERALLRSRALGQGGPQRLRVELVRMEVQHRVRIFGGHLFERFAQDGGRECAPVRAPAHWHRASADGPDGDRVLPDLASRRELEPVRSVRDVADALRDAGGVVLARVEAEAELGEDVIGPRRLAGNRERRGPVPDRTLPGELLDELRATLDVLLELVTALGRDAPVVVAVAREVVALGGDRPYEVGIALGGDSEDEERRARPELVEQVEDRGRLALEGGPACVPA